MAASRAKSSSWACSPGDSLSPAEVGRCFGSSAKVFDSQAGTDLRAALHQECALLLLKVRGSPRACHAGRAHTVSGRFAGVHRCAEASSLLCQAGAPPDTQIQERRRWSLHAIQLSQFNVKLFARRCVGCAGAFRSDVGTLGCHI